MKVDITIEELERIVVNAFMAGYNTTKEEMNTLSDNDPVTDQILFLLAKYRVKNM
jgi:regulator of RNase E activity RraB